jgi:hypothetical protein
MTTTATPTAVCMSLAKGRQIRVHNDAGPLGLFYLSGDRGRDGLFYVDPAGGFCRADVSADRPARFVLRDETAAEAARVLFHVVKFKGLQRVTFRIVAPPSVRVFRCSPEDSAAGFDQ